MARKRSPKAAFLSSHVETPERPARSRGAPPRFFLPRRLLMGPGAAAQGTPDRLTPRNPRQGCGH